GLAVQAALRELRGDPAQIARGASASQHTVVRDVALREELARLARRGHDVFQHAGPDRLRASGHAGRARLHARDLPLARERRIGLRILAAEDLQVPTEAVADRP